MSVSFNGVTFPLASSEIGELPSTRSAQNRLSE